MDFYDTNKDGRVHKDEYFGLPKSNQRYWESVDINSDECVPGLLLDAALLCLGLAHADARSCLSAVTPGQMR